MERLEENIKAVEVELTSYDMREIDSASSNIMIEGARYPEALEKKNWSMTDRTIKEVTQWR